MGEVPVVGNNGLLATLAITMVPAVLQPLTRNQLICFTHIFCASTSSQMKAHPSTAGLAVLAVVTPLVGHTG